MSNYTCTTTVGPGTITTSVVTPGLLEILVWNAVITIPDVSLQTTGYGQSEEAALLDALSATIIENYTIVVTSIENAPPIKHHSEWPEASDEEVKEWSRRIDEGS